MFHFCFLASLVACRLFVAFRLQMCDLRSADLGRQSAVGRVVARRGQLIEGLTRPTQSRNPDERWTSGRI